MVLLISIQIKKLLAEWCGFVFKQNRRIKVLLRLDKEIHLHASSVILVKVWHFIGLEFHLPAIRPPAHIVSMCRICAQLLLLRVVGHTLGIQGWCPFLWMALYHWTLILRVWELQCYPMRNAHGKQRLKVFPAVLSSALNTLSSPKKLWPNQTPKSFLDLGYPGNSCQRLYSKQTILSSSTHNHVHCPPKWWSHWQIYVS